jgi:hypothetical protein
VSRGELQKIAKRFAKNCKGLGWLAIFCKKKCRFLQVFGGCACNFLPKGRICAVYFLRGLEKSVEKIMGFGLWVL